MNRFGHIGNKWEDALHLQSVLETATDGIVIINQEGIVETYNAAAAKLFDYSKEEVIGKNIKMLMPANHAKQHDGYIQNYLHTKQPKIIGIGREVLGRRKDGTEFPMRLAVSEVVVENRRSFVGIIQDQTERRNAESQIKLLNKALEKKVRDSNLELQDTVNQLLTTNEKLKKEIEERIEIEDTLRHTEATLRESLDKEKKLGELKSRFVSMASHEFRTPLSTILSSTELIEMYDQGDQQEKRLRNINRIKASVATLTGILNDFLSLSKLEEGDIQAQPAEFELSEFCKRALEEIGGMLKPGQKIVHVEKNTGVHLNLDRKFLKNIMMNLLSNASKYSDPDGYIECRTIVEGGYLNVEVKDFGVGIPDEDQPYLFERFFRAHNVEHIQGTGLGLNIVKEYVDLLGGVVSFESELGIGTTFKVRIPLDHKL